MPRSKSCIDQERRRSSLDVFDRDTLLKYAKKFFEKGTMLEQNSNKSDIIGYIIDNEIARGKICRDKLQPKMTGVYREKMREKRDKIYSLLDIKEKSNKYTISGNKDFISRAKKSGSDFLAKRLEEESSMANDNLSELSRFRSKVASAKSLSELGTIDRDLKFATNLWDKKFKENRKKWSLEL